MYGGTKVKKEIHKSGNWLHGITNQTSKCTRDTCSLIPHREAQYKYGKAEELNKSHDIRLD